MERRSFPWAFERRKKFLYLGAFLQGIWEICKKALQTGSCLHRGPIGEPWEGFLRGKKMQSGFLLLDPEDNKILSLGTTWNFSKGTELPWADIRLCGTKGPFKRPRCTRTIRAQTQTLIIIKVTDHRPNKQVLISDDRSVSPACHHFYTMDTSKMQPQDETDH
jgi:hypothetical protein